MAKYELVTPFLCEDPLFAYGVSFGMFYSRLAETEEPEVKEYLPRWLQDQVLVTASRLGWDVAEMSPWKKDWLYFRLVRK